MSEKYLTPGSSPIYLVVNLRFVLDPLAAVMVLTITFTLAFLIHVYSISAMAWHDKRLSTYFGYLNLFTGAMLILILGATACR